jgi:lipopolysaccharide transport protein LptA
MADFNPSLHAAACTLLLLAAPGSIMAAPKVRQQAIVLDAQSADVTAENVVFHRVKIAQGEMSITAELGHGTGSPKNIGKKNESLDFDDSVWVFRGNVKITVEEGVVNSDEAAITFLKQALTKAVANGNPATFEGRMAKTGKVAHGHADTIDYDATQGIITLLHNAWLSDGQAEIRGESLKYNMNTQSIQGESTESGSQRVHIVVPPPQSKP